MYCRFCGEKINDDSRFCQACGKKQFDDDQNSNVTEEEAVDGQNYQSTEGYEDDVYTETEEQYSENEYSQEEEYSSDTEATNHLNEGEYSDVEHTEPYTVEEEIYQFEDERKTLGGKILKWGILSLAFCETFFLSPLALIFAIIGKIRIGKYEKYFGEPTGRAKVGQIFTKIGFILAIVLCAILTLFILTLFGEEVPVEDADFGGGFDF